MIFGKVLLIILSFFFVCCVLTSNIEDELETEIDSREPRSFTDRQFKILSVRQDGFNHLSCGDDKTNEKDSIFVPNWELFAGKYWYETHYLNCTCPMLPRGIATMVDWALMVPCLFGKVHVPPRTVFVHNYFLPHFVESTLKFMNPNYRFVLISGGSDLTIPRSIDVRYHPLRGFASSPDGGKYFQQLLGDPRIIHWYCENHDMSHPKISTLPCGMVGTNPDSAWNDVQYTTDAAPLSNRPLKFLVSDRLRSGGQWAARSEMAEKCMHSSLCVRPSQSEISHPEFLKHIVSVAFIACVHGGGLDPSPKAFEAILHGTIPIIQHTVLDDAYEKLPVMFVHDWSELFGSTEVVTQLLQSWLTKLAPYYEKNSELRQRTLDKLKTNYWMEQVHHRVKKYDEANMPQTAAITPNTNTVLITTNNNATSTNHSSPSSRHRRKLLSHYIQHEE